ncbi:UDP-3-O-acyl-N-acetylglucosamine deacetylase [Moraxella sp. ZY210820]|uniref:UDP-3-O-acyl-N-acetylglucosamine deacetylase n=1 Tax=unclassified Moraxella TaxID=2685852 RepID=UPI00273204C1|nr:UDP-3-O-acyl-N-acetylglucosamine deacetylase [Moraxella sp. ZY210820]WLF83876.1 UDP-3-O-acyl-N-acetylglucosamine deacetylase [Moraxella sp. ZY210820]
MLKQRTLQQIAEIQGVGLHSGQTVRMRFLPNDVDNGIIFRRVDLNPTVDIPAQALLIQEAFMCSNLVQDDVKVGTIEHVMSAVSALGIDNLIIEVDASELVIADGSAKPFIDLFLQTGLVEQQASKKFIKIIEPVAIQIEDKTASFTPYDGFLVNFKIDFQHPVFKPEYQFYSFDLHSQDYIEQISSARTFGFLRDLEMLQSKNLALGAGLHNAIGLDDEKVLNPEGLRFENEFVRHKILDAIGDLSLLGCQILAKFDGYKAGHAVNNALLRAVLANPNCYEIVTFDDIKKCPIHYLTV